MCVCSIIKALNARARERCDDAVGVTRRRRRIALALAREALGHRPTFDPNTRPSSHFSLSSLYTRCCYIPDSHIIHLVHLALIFLCVCLYGESKSHLFSLSLSFFERVGCPIYMTFVFFPELLDKNSFSFTFCWRK